MTKEQEIALQAAAFRRLVAHLGERKDVQNIELMNLAGFCRNCLSKWMLSEAQSNSIELDYASAQEQVYGMPYSQWKAEHQKPATEEQLATFAKIQAANKE